MPSLTQCIVASPVTKGMRVRMTCTTHYSCGKADITCQLLIVSNKERLPKQALTYRSHVSAVKSVLQCKDSPSGFSHSCFMQWKEQEMCQMNILASCQVLFYGKDWPCYPDRRSQTLDQIVWKLFFSQDNNKIVLYLLTLFG